MLFAILDRKGDYMKTCTFFGEPDATTDIRYDLKQVLIELIENKGVDIFYVGNGGNFDKMVRNELKLFSSVYKHIRFTVLTCDISYTDLTDDDFWYENICPLGEFFGGKNVTADELNRNMIDDSDYAVTYVTNKKGSAYKYKNAAKRKGKTVIELYSGKI